MKILVINCGSSSIKYKLYTKGSDRPLAKGLIEKIGEKGSSVKNHSQGIKNLVSDILESKIISSLDEIKVIGHRVVHGAETFRQPHLIDSRVIKKIKQCSSLAPLHNPANLAGIFGCRKLFPQIPQVAVFDTAFHQSISKIAYTYAINNSYYKKHKVRKYGFHGSSHQFVANQAAKLLKRRLSKLKLITCHLGNGCSIAAIDKGKCVDTSMGFTPLEGLVMGTRSGDIDVAAVFYIMKKEKLSVSEMDRILNKESGLLGVSGISNDFRLIQKAMVRGSKSAKLAYQVFVHRIKKYIGAYLFILGGADAICLTGGIGENSQRVIDGLRRDVSKFLRKKTEVLVIPTDEELMIAHLALETVKPKLKKRKKK
ncbi:MAG: acetate kinase [Candidatus Omnitrophica bacterium]|nr:acetate kinase [Candidatus Omnitrophota bacterium]